MYASSARSPEFGYLVTHVIVHGTVDVEKPALPELPETAGQAAAEGDAAGPLGPRQRRRVRRDRDLPARVGRGRATRSTGRRSSSTRRPRSRSRPGAARALDGHHIFHLTDTEGSAMAIVDADARAARRRLAAIGWDGQAPATRCSTESERLFAETGHYAGLRELELMALRPDRLREAVLAAARRPRLGARDRAEHLRLADRARARRAVLRAVHARGRLGRPVHRDHRPRPHDVRRDQVDGPQRLRGQPRHPAGRHLRQQRPDDRRRPQRRRADVRADLLGGRADRLGGRRHARARHRREHARRRAGRSDDALRGRHRPAVHEDRRARRARALAPRALQQAHARLRLLPARRAHPPGGLPHDPRRRRARSCSRRASSASSASAARSSRRAGARSSRASAR